MVVIQSIPSANLPTYLIPLTKGKSQKLCWALRHQERIVMARYMLAFG